MTLLSQQPLTAKTSSSLCGSLLSSSSTQDGMLRGLISIRPYSWSHSWCVFTMVMTMSWKQHSTVSSPTISAVLSACLLWCSSWLWGGEFSGTLHVAEFGVKGLCFSPPTQSQSSIFCRVFTQSEWEALQVPLFIQQPLYDPFPAKLSFSSGDLIIYMTYTLSHVIGRYEIAHMSLLFSL